MPPNTHTTEHPTLDAKMIELRIKFWTNGIAETPGAIRQRHSWDRGVVEMRRNRRHGINPERPKPFASLMDLPAVIEKVLIAHDIKLHHSNRSRTYYDD
jgi:hypothetical protein